MKAKISPLFQRILSSRDSRKQLENLINRNERTGIIDLGGGQRFKVIRAADRSIVTPKEEITGSK